MLLTLLKFNWKPLRAALFGAAVFILCAVSILAVPLAEYRGNVQKAANLLKELPTRPDKNEVLSEVRRLITPQQKIELPDGTSLDADNAWLETNLREIEKAKPSDLSAAVMQTTERLGAITDRLTELETAQEAALRSKNEDKQKLDEILRRPEFQPVQEKEPSILERWLDAIAKWFERSERTTPINQPQMSPPFIGEILRFVFIGLALALIGFIVWRFVIPMFGGNRRRTKKGKKEPRVILGETLAPDQTADDLLSQADRLAQSGDVRAAIRKGYIALLAELSERKVLGLAQHKTNRDYLRDVRRREEIYQPMCVLTNSFEQHWYGDVPAGENDWQQFRGQYREIVQNPKSRV